MSDYQINAGDIKKFLDETIERSWTFSDKPKVWCSTTELYDRHDATASFEFKYFTLSVKITGNAYNAVDCAIIFYNELNAQYAKALETYLTTLVSIVRFSDTRAAYNGVTMTAIEYATKCFMRDYERR